MMSVNKKGVKDHTFSNSNVGGGCTLETEARGQQHLRNMIQLIVVTQIWVTYYQTFSFTNFA